MLNERYLALARSAVVLTAFSLLAGCRHNTHIVRLMMHGPVVTAATNEKTTIEVPAVDSTDPLQHFLAVGYPSLEEATSTPCGAGAYKLSLKGIKPVEKKAGGSAQNDRRIDPAFKDITYPVPNWKPLGGPYFVTMDLPAAARIVAVGPQYKVQFGFGEGFVPLTQMLEFETRDSDDVRLVRTCGSDEKEYKVLSCKEMRARYDKVFKEIPPSDPKDPERDHIDFALNTCPDDASYLFVGIGTDPKKYRPDLSYVHGINFFNNKILPEIFGGVEKVPPKKRLVGDNYAPSGDYGIENRGVRLIRTSFGGEYPEYLPAPRYVPVTMIENCTSPGGFVQP